VKLLVLLPISLLSLAACTTAPTVRVMEVCPKVPVLELSLPEDALEQSFTDKIASFLQGKLSEPISYELPSKPALGLMMPPSEK
jgi:hypothetical protein